MTEPPPLNDASHSIARDEALRSSFGPEEGDDAFFRRLREAETFEPLGRLGEFELIAEAGRGGQGVVYRARQPGTRGSWR